MNVLTGPPGRGPQAVPDLDDLLVARDATDSRFAARAGGTGVAPPVDPGIPQSRAGETVRTVLALVLVLAVSLLLGSLLGTHGRTLVHNRMLPWILGRSLGLASYVALSAMVVLGLWLRHPWRSRFRRPAAPSILWAHVALAAGTLTLLVGHLTALALDRYAGVGWTGVFVPWSARYRPTPTALGTLCLYALVLVVGTAALAGSIGRRVWFPVHTVSVLVFCLALTHGILAGSDAYSLRWVYVVTGSLVLVLQATRWIAGRAGHGPAGVLE